MKKMVNIKVSATISTDFFIEVDENATSEEIATLAKKEVTLPTNYPDYIDKHLQTMGIQVRGIDNMLKSWNTDKIDYIIDA